MASTIEKTILRLQFDKGLGEDGKQKYTTKSFQNLRHDAEDTNLLQVSNAVGALSQEKVLRTTKVQTTLIEA